MLTRSQKELEVAELHDRFKRATSVFVAEYRGLDVASVDALRAKMRAAGAGDFEYRVAKNTLLRRAAEGSAGATLVHVWFADGSVPPAKGICSAASRSTK